MSVAEKAVRTRLCASRAHSGERAGPGQDSPQLDIARGREKLRKNITFLPRRAAINAATRRLLDGGA